MILLIKKVFIFLKLKRAIVRNTQTGNLEPAEYRISKRLIKTL